MSISLNPDSDQLQQSREQAQSFVQQYLADIGDEPFSAKELLEQNPSLKNFQSCVIDLAYEEFCRRRENGTDVQPTEFVRDFQGVEQSLYRVIEFDQVLHDHPSLIENVPEDRWPDVGDDFCGFELTELIGRGALSRVFTARQTSLGGRRVVVKVCIRGEREAEFLGKLEHRNIAAVHSVHVDAETGLVAICMPYVTRATLHHVAEWLPDVNRPECTAETIHEQIVRYNHGLASSDDDLSSLDDAPPGDTLAMHRGDTLGTIVSKWGVQLAEALHFAHGKSVLHCDVKPANVLLREDLSASLLDFNLASDQNDALRLAGGTLPYMASEQLLHLMSSPEDQSTAVALTEESASARTDVFGLCATLWHLVTGEPPFGVCADAKGRADAAAIILQRQESGLSTMQIQSLTGHFGTELCEVLRKGLQADPQERYADAEELSQAFRELLPPPPKPARAWRWWTSALLLAAVAITAPVLYNVTQSRIARETATNEAVTLISSGRFGEARSLLTPYVKNDPQARFLDLVSQTCGLDTICNHSRNAVSIDHDTDRPSSITRPEIVSDWIQLQVDWQAMTQSGSYRSEAALNLAFVELELGTESYLQNARTHFKLASESDLQTEAMKRIMPVLSITEATDPQSAADILFTQAPQILEKGTRGEVVALIAVTRRVLNKTVKRVLEESPDAQTLPEPLLAVIDQILTCLEHGGRAEPGLSRNLVLPRMENITALWERCHALKKQLNGRPVPNTLSNVVVLPGGQNLPSSDNRERNPSANSAG